MIDKDQMMGVLLDACPSFSPKWRSFLDDWADEPDELPLHIALADFARHLIGMLERNDKYDPSAVFTALERLHVEGDDYVREAATVGLLECLQNRNLHTATEPEQFRPYLGPVSLKWWDKLYLFWERGEPLTDT